MRKLALPTDFVEAALRQGRVVFPWKMLRSWIRPATAPGASAHDAIGTRIAAQSHRAVVYRPETSRGPSPEQGRRWMKPSRIYSSASRSQKIRATLKFTRCTH